MINNYKATIRWLNYNKLNSVKVSGEFVLLLSGVRESNAVCRHRFGKTPKYLDYSGTSLVHKILRGWTTKTPVSWMVEAPSHPVGPLNVQVSAPLQMLAAGLISKEWIVSVTNPPMTVLKFTVVEKGCNDNFCAKNGQHLFWHRSHCDPLPLPTGNTAANAWLLEPFCRHTGFINLDLKSIVMLNKLAVSFRYVPKRRVEIHWPLIL